MWQIIGAGAIGCLWAANLQRTGQNIHMVVRKPLQTSTLSYQDLDQQISLYSLSCSTKLKNAIDPILVCVKATQVVEAIKLQQHRINEQQAIILMHNGMGCAEQVQQFLPNNPIICATTANASLLTAPLTIQQTGSGITYLGAFNPLAKEQKDVISPLQLAIENTHWEETIEEKLWLKLLINIAINPLTAIYQINNGQLNTSKFANKVKSIVEETVQVANAENFAFSTTQTLDTVKQVISNTEQNYSSMNRDIHFQRITENEFICGYLLNKAKHHGLELPLITQLYQAVNQLTYKEGGSLNSSIK